MDTQFGFIGLGLIGGSIARALRETVPSCKITAYSRKPKLSDDLQNALDNKVLDDVVFSLTGLSDCDYIFLFRFNRKKIAEPAVGVYTAPLKSVSVSGDSEHSTVTYDGIAEINLFHKGMSFHCTTANNVIC